MNNNEYQLDGSSFFPVVGLKITKKCRFKCGFCCEKCNSYGEYDIDSFHRIIDLLAQSGVKRICFTGGEPLCYNCVNDLIIHAHNKGIEVVLLSADPYYLRKLSIQSIFIDSIRVSIHGYGRIHDEIVGCDGVFEEMNVEIKRLISLGFTINVASVVTPQNANSIMTLANWCSERHIETLYLFNLLSSGLGDSYIKTHGRLESSEILSLCECIKSNTNLKVKPHLYESNAECIIIYGNGDVIIDPYSTGINHQLFIGNIFTTAPCELFYEFRKNPELWNDYYKRYLRSSIHSSK